MPAGLGAFPGWSTGAGAPVDVTVLVDDDLHEATLRRHSGHLDGRVRVRVLHAVPLGLVATVGRGITRIARDPVAEVVIEDAGRWERRPGQGGVVVDVVECDRVGRLEPEGRVVRLDPRPRHAAVAP